MKKIKINHLDLFSGIGGFHLGFEKAGFEVNSYFSEVDKYAIDVYKNNFKNSTYVGSVTNVRAEQLPKIDAITFGSPCQDFSLAGKRKGMGGSRSSLITEAIRLIDECRPRFFIWENVKGTFSSNNGEDFWAIIQAFTNIGGYRLEWQLLNTKWFLPQNRERIYLVGYLGDGSGGQVFPIREKFKKYKIKRGIEKTSLDWVADFRNDEGLRIKKDKISYTLLAQARQDGTAGQNIIKIKSATSKGYEEAIEGDSINYSNPNSKTRRGRVGKGVAQTLDTCCNQAVIGAMRGRYNKDNKTEQQLEINKNGTSNTLTAVTKDNLVIGYSRDSNGKVVNRHLKNEANTLHSSSGSGGNTDQYIYNYGQKSLNETLQKENLSNEDIKALDLYNKKAKEDCPTLTEPHHNSLRLYEKGLIRRLTPIECERLQGFPDNWTEYGESGKISDTQRYKMCGNAVTVDVVEAVASSIIKTIY